MATAEPTATLAADHATGSFSNEKLILNDGTELTTVSGGAILKRYLKEGSWKYDVVDYTDVNVIDGTVNVWYNTTYADELRTKVQSNMIVVEVAEEETPIDPTEGEILITATKGIDDDDEIVSTAAGNTLKATFNGTGTIKTVQWFVNNIAVDTATTAKVTLEQLANPDDGDKVYVTFVDSDDNVFASDVYTFEDPEFATATFAKDGDTLSWKSTDVEDQFGESFKLTAVATTAIQGTTDDGLTATMTTGDGTATITFAGGGTTAIAERTTSATPVTFGTEVKLDWVNLEIAGGGSTLAHGDISSVAIIAQ